MTREDALGALVARGLDARQAEREQAIDVACRALLAGPEPRRGSRLWTGSAAALAASVAAALLAIGLWSRPPRALVFTADGKIAAVQTWISAPKSKSLELGFSDGTRWRVEPSSRVRVVEVGAYGASMALENGALHADVVHTSRSAWRVNAGPLTVRVTGTRFDLQWSVLTEEFVIFVREGAVEVAGSVVGTERPVRAGETLRVSVAEQRLELTKGPPRGATSPSLGATPSTEQERAALEQSEPARGDETESSATPQARPADVREREPDWRELARQGLLRRAFLAAEASGFQGACDSASPAQLLLLGDASRLAGNPERSKQALLALRRRYPRDPRRAAAAFALGKVAFDQSRSFAEAAEWFEICVREQPAGSLSREASGRLIEARQKAGNASGARLAARDYLTRFPSGPHADVARSLLRP